ncbi:MAG: CDP-diacylglycerol--serine O-phosphatidyltransferase [Candidatus Omnitrophota bacterium]|jgi:CDP-diacylglycerol--serine O-phosphatidyltransferase|nr:MAG: CDP-diacylglycerol--serine O-phosphatidyltransferase [Candidatus Omnitrophota bacterium]
MTTNSSSPKQSNFWSRRKKKRLDAMENTIPSRTGKFRVRRFKPRRKEIKLVHLLPNLLTCFNVACGVSSIIYGIEGKYEIAAMLILLAAFFDLIDGKVARLFGSSSSYGLQLDSLADVISFGVAPPVLMHTILYKDLDRLGLSMVLVYTLCTALRLARYNVQAALVQKRDHFVGLPCPVPACFIAALVLVCHDYFGPVETILPQAVLRTGIHVGLVVLACLMVSTIRYPDLSSWQVKKRNIYQHTVFIVLILCVTVLIVKIVILSFAMVFIASGPLGAIREFYKRPYTEPADEAGVDASDEPDEESALEVNRK